MNWATWGLPLINIFDLKFWPIIHGGMEDCLLYRLISGYDVKFIISRIQQM